MKQASSGLFKFALTAILLSGLVGVGFGLFLLLIDVAFLMNIIFVIIGILTVFNNLPSLLLSAFDMNSRESAFLFVLSFFATAVGIAMIFFHNWVLMVVLGVYFVAMPLVRLLVSKRRQELLGGELPKMILGVIMLLLGPASVLTVLFRVAGFTVIALSVIYMIVATVFLCRARNKPGRRVFVDETGDGVIDAVFVDADENGKTDYVIPYRDDR